jgi:hypothetical protein
MKLVSCNKMRANDFFLINTQDTFEVLTVVKMSVIVLGCDTV